jgi:hypothetical protein
VPDVDCDPETVSGELAGDVFETAVEFEAGGLLGAG